MLMLLFFVLVVMVVFFLLVLVMGMGRAFVDGKVDGLNVLPGFAFPMGVEIADLQLAQFPLESGGLYAEIAQCADGHIAANA
jgi:hypothetical protein